MRRSGLLVYQILHALREMVQEGVSTWDLEVAAVKMIKDAGAKPAFQNYSCQRLARSTSTCCVRR